MTKRFEEFANPTRQTLQSLVRAMSQPHEVLQTLRQQFKTSINAYFTANPPFPTHGQNINADIAMYVKLISYCLEAGDTEVLKKWGMAEVAKNPAVMLVSNNKNEYYAICQAGREGSKTALEEDCWTILAEFFLSPSPSQHPTVRRFSRHQR